MIIFGGQEVKMKVTWDWRQIWRPGRGIIQDNLGSSSF